MGLIWQLLIVAAFAEALQCAPYESQSSSTVSPIRPLPAVISKEDAPKQRPDENSESLLRVTHDAPAPPSSGAGGYPPPPSPLGRQPPPPPSGHYPPSPPQPLNRPVRDTSSSEEDDSSEEKVNAQRSSSTDRITQSTTARGVSRPASFDPAVQIRPLDSSSSPRERRDTPSSERPRLTKDVPKSGIPPQQPPVSNSQIRQARDAQSTTQRAVHLPATVDPPQGIKFQPLESNSGSRQRRDTPSSERPRLTKDVPKSGVRPSHSRQPSTANSQIRQARDAQSTTQRAVHLPASVDPPKGTKFQPLESNSGSRQ